METARVFWDEKIYNRYKDSLDIKIKSINSLTLKMDGVVLCKTSSVNDSELDMSAGYTISSDGKEMTVKSTGKTYNLSNIIMEVPIELRSVYQLNDFIEYTATMSFNGV